MSDVVDRLPIGWHSLSVLRRMRVNETTHVYGPYSLLSLHELGRTWGEAEWTARDIHSPSPREHGGTLTTGAGRSA